MKTRTSDDTKISIERARPVPPAGYLTPCQHCAEAARLLWVIDDQLQNDSVPRSLLDLAVIALGHAITALASAAFDDPEPGDTDQSEWLNWPHALERQQARPPRR